MRPPLTTPQSSAISPPNSWTIRLTELLEGAVRSDQEGEYVEPLGSLVADQPSPGPPRGSDRGRALLGFPISPELRNPHAAPSFRANLLDQKNRLADSTRIQ